MTPVNGLDLSALLGKLSPEKQQAFAQLASQISGKGGM